MESVLRHDRLLVAAGLLAVTLWAWLHTLGGGAEHGALAPAAWSPAHAAMVFLMWWIMMTAMMLPSAAPLILLFAALRRRRQPGASPHAATLALAAGYLLAWGAFSIAATLLQWSLHLGGLFAPDRLAVGAGLGSVILLAAGLYQLTPLKQACLRRCRSPVAFLTAHWRPGLAGACRMGIAHGVVCLGCCWFLMGLLLVGGVMSPLWIGGIALYVLVEKLGPHGERLSRVGGLLLLAAGGMMLASAIGE